MLDKMEEKVLRAYHLGRAQGMKDVRNLFPGDFLIEMNNKAYSFQALLMAMEKDAATTMTRMLPSNDLVQ